MTTTLFLLLIGLVVVVATIGTMISGWRDRNWATVLLCAGFLAFLAWIFWDTLVVRDPRAAGAWFVELAALISLIFVPWIAFQYLREVLAERGAASPVASSPSVSTKTVANGVSVPPSPADINGSDAAIPDGPLTPESRLRAAQEHFQDFAESSRSGLWIQDVQSDSLIYVSPAFEAIWGKDAEAFYRDSHARLSAVHPEDRLRVTQSLVRAKTGREFDEEYRVETADGHVRWVWDRGVPVRDDAGRVVHLAGFAEDITQRKGVEEVNLFRANFVANMSHEVRTPLNIMIGYLEFLLDGTFGDLSQQQREITERVRKNAEELLDLMSASLDLSRLDNRTIPLAIEGIELPSLLEDIAVDTSKLAEGSGVDVRCELDPELPVLHSDRQKLKMILKNLLSNALKFTERGEVTVIGRTTKNGVEIAVRDTGIGISAGALPLVFEPFRQGESKATDGKKGGVGLGLYIVRRLVDILEGRINVESTPGQGTTFRVWLPVALSPARSFEPETPTDEELASADVF